MTEFHYIEEVAPWTREQWDYLIKHGMMSDRHTLQGLLAAEEFLVSIKKIQSLAGHSQESLGEISQGLLALAQEELPDNSPDHDRSER